MKDPATEHGTEPPAQEPRRPGGMGLAMRMSTDLVSAVFVGGGLGYLLDYWLNTKPWLTLVFLFLGMAAGFRDMYRCASGETPPRPARKEKNGDDAP
ncbi:MAG: AtpZ/AtpI family protein [Magnetococcales bacterium]|nr:AtpZ/AtpI family protein [Magnetococcales bacterium]